MLHIAIVEDSAQDAQILQDYLEQYQCERGMRFKVTRYTDGDEIAYEYKGGYDLILMDIEMRYMDGMSAAEAIRRVDPAVAIMFITNSPQYAIKGYEVRALDYILKPIQYYAFSQHMNRVLTLIDNRQKTYIQVSAGGDMHRLDVSTIYYVEVCNHDLIYHTSNGVVQTSGSMREAEEHLPKESFFRCSKGYLVNLEHVDGVQEEDAVVHGERVQISRAKRKAFLEALNHYIGEVL